MFSKGCLEISSISCSAKDNESETKLLNSLKEIEASVLLCFVEDCQCLPPKENAKKVIEGSVLV